MVAGASPTIPANQTRPLRGATRACAYGPTQVSAQWLRDCK